MAACHPVLESHHQEVLGQVAGDEDIWAPLVCKLPLQSRCWLKARNEWIMMGEDECLFNVLTVCPSACVYVKHEHF